MDENIYGGPRTERLKFFSDLHSIASDLSTGTISVEQANKLLMLACGSFHNSSTESLDMYTRLRFPPTVELKSQLSSYLGSLETPGGKIHMIKKCRELSGMGLKEAKDYIELHFPEVRI